VGVVVCGDGRAMAIRRCCRGVVSGKKKVLRWLLLCTLSVGFRVPVLTLMRVLMRFGFFLLLGSDDGVDCVVGLFCEFSARVSYHLQREVLRLSWALYMKSIQAVSP
jgi:hypothetical protein